MKKKTKQFLERLCYGILIVCGIGLLLATVGLIFKTDPLYYTGLILASPLFLVVLPVCLLLVALFPVAGIYAVICCIKNKINTRSNNNDSGKNEGVLNNQ